MKRVFIAAFSALCVLVAAPIFAQAPGGDAVEMTVPDLVDPVILTLYTTKGGMSYAISYPSEPAKVATYQLVSWEQRDDADGNPVCELELAEIDHEGMKIDHDVTKTESQIMVDGIGLHPLVAFLEGELQREEDNVFDCLPRDNRW